MGNPSYGESISRRSPKVSGGHSSPLAREARQPISCTKGEPVAFPGRFLSWFTRNWADTDEPGDPSLAPLELALPLSEALAHVEAAILQLPRWRVESLDLEAAVVKATRRTRLFRFVDDVTVRLEPTAAGTRVHARSQARLGKGDFGQNRRNLLALFRALRSPPTSGRTHR
jgi:uncharacterized protein (DUF1499 family)